MNNPNRVTYLLDFVSWPHQKHKNPTFISPNHKTRHRQRAICHKHLVFRLNIIYSRYYKRYDSSIHLYPHLIIFSTNKLTSPPPSDTIYL